MQSNQEDTDKQRKEKEKKMIKAKNLPMWVCCASAKVRNMKYRIYTCELHSYNFQSGDK